MENASDDINRFSNPNANANATATTSTSSFTFSTPSVSGLSRPRFVKVRKPNNAPAFNPFLNGAAATNAAFATTDFASRIGDPFRNLKIGEGFDAKGEFAFATNASSRVDENSVSEQINNLKIVTDNESNELDLRNELKKKLSIKEGRGSNAAVAENSAHEVVYQLKNLNVNDAIGSNVHKSAVDVKPSLENVTTFQNRETEAADLLRKVEMLNLVKEKEDCVEPNLCNPFVEGIHPRVASCGAQVASEDFGMYQSAASSSASASASVFFQPAGVGKREEFVFTGKQYISGSSFVEFNTPAPKIGKDGKLKEKGSKVRINKSREKLKHYSSAQPWHGLGFFF